MSIQQFNIGDQVACRSLCDYDCIFRFTVISRSKKFVTLQYFNQTKRVVIRQDSDSEYCYPLGTSSMSPLLRAGRNPE